MAIEITGAFEEALKLLEAGAENIFITGRAGTGKSTLLQIFREQTKKSIARGRTPLGGSGPLVVVVSAAVIDAQSYVLAVNALHRDRHARRDQLPAGEGREAVASR